MFSLDTIEEKIVGILHDVIEDTPITLFSLHKIIYRAIKFFNLSKYNPFLKTFLNY